MTTLAPVPPQMLVSNVIQLVNESPDRRFDMEYAPKTRLQLAPFGQPGDRIFVNEEVAWYFLGSWWTDNNNPRMKMRQIEYQRLRTLYGAYEDEGVWAASLAHVLVAYSPDGQRITTIVDDPEGVAGGTATQLGREMSLESQMAILQDTILQMQAQIAAQSVQSANEEQPGVPSDPIAAPRPPGPPVPGPQVASVSGTQVAVPVAPATIPVEDDPDAANAFGNRLEPTVVVIPLDPAEQDVPEDAPQSIPHGPAPTGGRISG